MWASSRAATHQTDGRVQKTTPRAATQPDDQCQRDRRHGSCCMRVSTGHHGRPLDRLGPAAGRRLSIDQSVFESERRTGHRNRAIAHLLLNFGIVHDEAEASVDVYSSSARSR